MPYFLQGFILGLAYVAPIGAQNLFVINTGLTQSTKRVYQTAFIVMFFDITLAIACFFGIGALMTHFPLLRMVVLCIGSLVLLYMAYGLIRAKSSLEKTNVDIPISKVISMACVVTWFNPQALIDGTFTLGAFRATLPPTQSLIFIIGVSIASVAWWLFVSTLTHLFGSKLNDKFLRIVNVVCGMTIGVYGIKLFLTFLKMLTQY